MYTMLYVCTRERIGMRYEFEWEFVKMRVFCVEWDFRCVSVWFSPHFHSISVLCWSHVDIVLCDIRFYERTFMDGCLNDICVCLILTDWDYPSFCNHHRLHWFFECNQEPSGSSICTEWYRRVRHIHMERVGSVHRRHFRSIAELHVLVLAHVYRQPENCFDLIKRD